MTQHLCTSVTPGCYRCELGLDEVAAIQVEDQADAEAAWITYRNAEIFARSWAQPKRVMRQLRRGSFIAGFIAGRTS